MQYFFHRLYRFRPAKPRRRFGKVLFGLAGIAVLLLLLVFGLFIGLGMLIFGGVRRLLSGKRDPSLSTSRNTIDAEYSVVRPRQNIITRH